MYAIESDWPPEIALEVVSPLTYLKTLASALSQITKGIIEAKVVTTTDKFEDGHPFSHNLLIFASALGKAEIELLEVLHGTDLIYPCWIYSRASEHGGSLSGENKLIGSFDELRKTMREVLRSPETLGRIHSLIARVNDMTSR